MLTEKNCKANGAGKHINIEGADFKNQPNMQISFVRGGWFGRYMTGLLK